MYVIGAFLLMIGLLVDSIQAMQSVMSGRDTAQHAFSAVAFRICGRALFMGAWRELIPMAAQITNGMTGLILHDAAVKDALSQSFRVTGAGTAAFAAGGATICATTGVGCVVTPAILLLLLLLVACTVVIVLIIKYVLAYGFAFMFDGGPVAIGASGIPGIGEPASNALVRGLAVGMMIPVVWCICFATWTGVIASIGAMPTGVSDAVLQVINGPGMFAAAMLVLLGLTRKLLQMASPLGAPIGLPGPVKLALGALAFKVADPRLSALADKIRDMGGAGASGGGASSVDGTATEVGGDVESTATEMSGDLGGGRQRSGISAWQDMHALPAARSHQMPAANFGEWVGGYKHDGTWRELPGVNDGDVIEGTATSPEDAALARIYGLRESVGALDHRAAWDSLAPSEQTAVQASANTAVASSDDPAAQRSAYEFAIARDTTTGRIANPHTAAVLGTASPQQVQAFGPPDGGSPKRAPSDAGSANPSLADHLREHDFRDGDLVGGADLASFTPPPPPPPA
jgi:hypothetical protein